MIGLDFFQEDHNDTTGQVSAQTTKTGDIYIEKSERVAIDNSDVAGEEDVM